MSNPVAERAAGGALEPRWLARATSRVFCGGLEPIVIGVSVGSVSRFVDLVGTPRDSLVVDLLFEESNVVLHLHPLPRSCSASGAFIPLLEDSDTACSTLFPTAQVRLCTPSERGSKPGVRFETAGPGPPELRCRAMPVERANDADRLARIEQMSEEYRAAQRRLLRERAIKLWRQAEAHRLAGALEVQPRRVH
jgi:hypothetical protein